MFTGHYKCHNSQAVQKCVEETRKGIKSAKLSAGEYVRYSVCPPRCRTATQSRVLAQ